MENNIKMQENVIEKEANFTCELVKIKYNEEQRREDSIILQSSHMQTAFSFTTAALFMVATIAFENSTVLSKNFLILVFSSITAVLLLSLFAATMAQNRKKIDVFPNGNESIKYIEENESLFETEAQRQKYLAKSYAEMQKSLNDSNNKRVRWIQFSMGAFYVSIGLSIIWFFFALAKTL